MAYEDSVDCAQSTGVGMPFRDQRADRYEALAGLFRFPECIPVDSIEVLLRGCAECPYRGSEHLHALTEAGDLARAWATNVRCGGSLAAAHARLFGAADDRHLVGCVFATETSYRPEDPNALVDEIVAEYRAVGYWGQDVEPRPLCPGHISNELGFVAHCLLLGDLGVAPARDAAERFFATHLEPWAMLFGATVASSADHPVLRFAGLALEQFMVCETQNRGASPVLVEAPDS